MAEAHTDIEQLIDRAQQGSRPAYEELIRSHEVALLRHARGLCRDRSLAQDLAQETLLEAWRSIRRYNGRCRFSTWLYAILLHRHQKHLRRAKRWPVSFPRVFGGTDEDERTPSEPVDDSTPEGHAEDIDRATQVRRAIDQLPSAQRQVILLRFYEDAPLAEIAAALKCRLGTVKSRLHYGLEKLRLLVEPPEA